MAWWILILQVVSGGDALTQATLNMSLKEALQEYVVCRKEYAEYKPEFDKALERENLFQQDDELEAIRLRVLAKCRVKP
ncbi:MAG: hypothetical protein Q8N04_06055 [Nitrospira sp.]|nr:hypothetical protein [Nitrospira sp.]